MQLYFLLFPHGGGRHHLCFGKEVSASREKAECRQPHDQFLYHLLLNPAPLQSSGGALMQCHAPPKTKFHFLPSQLGWRAPNITANHSSGGGSELQELHAHECSHSLLSTLSYIKGFLKFISKGESMGPTHAQKLMWYHEKSLQKKQGHPSSHLWQGPGM